MFLKNINFIENVSLGIVNLVCQVVSRCDKYIVIAIGFCTNKSQPSITYKVTQCNCFAHFILVCTALHCYLQ